MQAIHGGHCSAVIITKCLIFFAKRSLLAFVRKLDSRALNVVLRICDN